eukprot:jgi/Picsp_1/3514/NSC_06352-R1_hypothetical protein CHLNCDRAFT_133204 [Chlorella variabilis]
MTEVRSAVQPDEKRKAIETDGESQSAQDGCSAGSSGSSGSSGSRNSEASWQTLEDFTREEFAGRAATKYLSTRESRHDLKEAFLKAARTPHPSSGWSPMLDQASSGTDHQGSSQGVILLGVVASDVRYAVRSLRDYCNALNIPFVAPVPRGMTPVPKVPAIVGPVYIRYNSSTGQCTITTYSGRDRGVLVQFGSIQVGHLPLGLLDEDMSQPEPPA